MRIDSSMIGMDSVRTYTSKTSYKSSFALNSKQATKKMGEEDTGENMQDVFSGTGGSFEDLYGDSFSRMSSVRIARANENRSTKAMIGTLKQQCLNYILLLLFGRKEKTDFGNMADVLTADPSQMQFSESGNTTFTLNRTKEYFYMEEEQTGFSTKGTVVTADGRQIEFGLSFEMSRSFAKYYREEVAMEQVQLCDPLVINLDGNPTQISDQKFYFDLDEDGILDEVSKLGSGSGFLALDLDEDGKIGNGSELFGTKSGDGFGDLAKLDLDGNGWIDENDEIFEKLLIWTTDEDGNEQLYHLKQAGVGAICLSHVSTDFAYKDAENMTNGYLRESGIFLFEDGRAGTMAHVDFAT